MVPAIRDVWKCDVQEAFHEISHILDDFNYVAIDTEFPGIVLSPSLASSMSVSAINFLQLRENVNSLKIIQIGLSFSDAHGKKPPGVHTYQFNFEFDLWNELYAPDAIELLKKAGINFEMHAGGQGISVAEFGEQLMSSGLVLNDDIHWISFHGMYDFAYPLQLLTNQQLPGTPQEFFESLAMFFPVLTDLKYLLRSVFRGGLQALASSVGVERFGAQHQGGSDALLTMDTFFRLPHNVQTKAFSGCLFGLNSEDKFWYDTVQTPENVYQRIQSGITHGAMQECWDYATVYHEETVVKEDISKIPYAMLHSNGVSHATGNQAAQGMPGAGCTLDISRNRWHVYGYSHFADNEEQDPVMLHLGRPNWNRCGRSSMCGPNVAFPYHMGAVDPLA